MRMPISFLEPKFLSASPLGMGAQPAIGDGGHTYVHMYVGVGIELKSPPPPAPCPPASLLVRYLIRSLCQLPSAYYVYVRTRIANGSIHECTQGAGWVHHCMSILWAQKTPPHEAHSTFTFTFGHARHCRSPGASVPSPDACRIQRHCEFVSSLSIIVD